VTTTLVVDPAYHCHPESTDTTYLDWALNAGYRKRKYQETNLSCDQPSVFMGSELFGSTGVKFAFVKENFEDHDDCPDQAKGPVKIEHGKITTPPAFFASGKDVILKKSFSTLEMVASIFNVNAWVKKVRVEGHGDDRGNDNFNMQLSERRAASVRNFLLAHGVEPERLESHWYGETQPVDSNKTSKGRAKNRRVDFVILDPPQSQNLVQL